MIDSTNPRILADNIRHLSGESGSQASDISALQATVTALGSYSTNETDIGKKWIDGSTIYRKVFYIEHMPNNTTDTIAHGISNLGYVIALYGMVFYGSGYAGRPIPYAGSPTVRYTDVNIEIQAQNDISDYSGFLAIEYTKSATPSALNSPAPDDSRSIEPEEIPEVREEDPETEPVIDEPIEEPVAEVKKTTRKKSTN